MTDQILFFGLLAGLLLLGYSLRNVPFLDGAVDYQFILDDMLLGARQMHHRRHLAELNRAIRAAHRRHQAAQLFPNFKPVPR